MARPSSTRTASKPPSGIQNPGGLPELLLYRVSQLLAVAGAPITRLCEGRFGITRREWRLIALLAERDGISSSALAERAQLDRARTSRSLTALAEKRLITRRSTTGDGRAVRIQLTASGRTLFESLWPLAVDHHRQLLQCLTPTQIGAVDSALTALHARAEQLLLAYPDLPLADRRRGAARRLTNV
ncbi:MAG: MarR family transcriptional regulator [Betaproteobacteria bacterium]|nr:MAG: MarR family transcriptional regulator [Betaproteobacteria bacterium]